MGEHFPNIVPASTSKFQQREPLITPSPNGETIAELHDRVAVALDAIIGEVDAEIADYEAHHPEEIHRSKAILLCSHAAPIIAMGRALTGNTPRNAFERDFKPFVAGLFKFVRRRRMSAGDAATCADETGKGGSGVVVPDWKNNKGVRGGWDCVVNGSCEHLNEGEGRVWYVNTIASFFLFFSSSTPGFTFWHKTQRLANQLSRILLIAGSSLGKKTFCPPQLQPRLRLRLRPRHQGQRRPRPPFLLDYPTSPETVAAHPAVKSDPLT